MLALRTSAPLYVSTRTVTKQSRLSTNKECAAARALAGAHVQTPTHTRAYTIQAGVNVNEHVNVFAKKNLKVHFLLLA